MPKPAVTKVRCVTYKDEFSADRCTYNDLLIGVKHKTVGCGSKVFNASKTGDLVIITGNLGKARFFTIGTLKERLESCDLWAAEGGRVWDYNFTYEPLTGVHEVTAKVEALIAASCKKHEVDPRYVMHSRFCGERYAPVLRDLVDKL